MDPKYIRAAILSLLIVPFFAGMAAGTALERTLNFTHYGRPR